MTVGEFQSAFSKALDEVRNGETSILSSGRSQQRVAAIVPYSELKDNKPRPLGLRNTKLGLNSSAIAGWMISSF
jgi:antitoxin (DNA-binding transcriptional repressor) of toxin-antitoxin stability system